MESSGSLRLARECSAALMSGLYTSVGVRVILSVSSVCLPSDQPAFSSFCPTFQLPKPVFLTFCPSSFPSFSLSTFIRVCTPLCPSVSPSPSRPSVHMSVFLCFPPNPSSLYLLVYIASAGVSHRVHIYYNAGWQHECPAESSSYITAALSHR